MSLCINCGIATDRCNTIGRRKLVDEVILSIVRKWVAPKIVDENDFVCQCCWNYATCVHTEGKRPIETPRGYRQVCILCGPSLLRQIRLHPLGTGSVEENTSSNRIHEIIKEWIQPRTVGALSAVCHACWMRAKRASHRFNSGLPISATSSEPVSKDILHIQEPSLQQESLNTPNQPPTVATIVLPMYFRPIETQSRCFVKGCKRKERNRIKLPIRKQLLKTHNFYVPPNNRLCDLHLTSWEFLNNTDNFISTFNANQIQDMLSLKD